MRLLWMLAEWICPALREWRIGYEMSEGGEDCISARDAAWMCERNRRLREARAIAR